MFQVNRLPQLAHYGFVDSRVSGFIALVSEAGPFEPRQVTQYAHDALAEDPEFDSKLVSLIQKGEAISADTAIRILRGLECFCSKPRLLEHLLKLKSIDGRVRSKVILTVGRLVQNPQWLREQLKDINSRVRANAIEALWGVDVPEVEQLLSQAASDSHNRVIANAAVGLHKLGNTQCIPIINGLLQNKRELFRRSGLFAVSQIRDPRYLKKARRHLKAATAEERTWAEIAVKSIIENQHRAGFLPHMDIEVRQFTTLTNGLRVATLSCIVKNLNRWLEPADLAPLDFVITEGNRQIENQALHPVGGNGALSAVILFPAAYISSAQLFREMWCNGREVESIALLPYHSSDVVVPPLSHEDDLRITFDSQMDNLVEQMERGDVRVADNAGQAILKGIQALKHVPDSRHIVILVDPCTRIELSPVVAAALHNPGIQIHAVISDKADADTVKAVEALSHASGGTIVESKSVDALRQLLLSIRVSQFGMFELSWMAEETKATKVTIQCCSCIGAGETTCITPDNHDSTA